MSSSVIESLTERQMLLRHKLEGNSQRNSRRACLASLPDDLGSELSGCPFLSSAEYAAIASQFIISAEGYGSPPLRPSDYFYCEFAWRPKVLEEIGKPDARHDTQPAFFWLGGDNPIYQVKFGWVRANFDRLLQYQLGVIALDNSAGLVVDEHCGYVEDDPNPDEVVFEVANWGFNDS